MKRKLLLTTIVLSMTLPLLCACGSSSASYKYADEGYSEEYDMPSEPAYAAEESAYYEPSDEIYEASDATDYSNGSAELVEQPSTSNRKLIKNMNLNLETEEFDKLLANIEYKVNSLGGYIETSDISGRSMYSTDTKRTANITARIPNNKMDDFVTDVAAQSNITNKSQSTQDITLSYTDTKAHIDSLKSEQTRLNDLIMKADDLDTILTLEARLTEVSYQIESYERQLRSYDNQVDYATIYLFIQEVYQYTEPPKPVEVPKTAGERIKAGLSENLYSIGHGISEFFIAFVIALPKLIFVLLIIGINVLIVLFIIRLCRKAARKREEKRAAILRAQYEQQQKLAQAAVTNESETDVANEVTGSDEEHKE